MKKPTPEQFNILKELVADRENRPYLGPPHKAITFYPEAVAVKALLEYVENLEHELRSNYYGRQ
jgi:hypothetical protein